MDHASWLWVAAASIVGWPTYIILVRRERKRSRK